MPQRGRERCKRGRTRRHQARGEQPLSPPEAVWDCFPPAAARKAAHAPRAGLPAVAHRPSRRVGPAEFGNVRRRGSRRERAKGDHHSERRRDGWRSLLGWKALRDGGASAGHGPHVKRGFPHAGAAVPQRDGKRCFRGGCAWILLGGFVRGLPRLRNNRAAKRVILFGWVLRGCHYRRSDWV